MTTSKLPARPSLESLRKQAKKLARGIAAGDASAIARARARLPQAKLPGGLPGLPSGGLPGLPGSNKKS